MTEFPVTTVDDTLRRRATGAPVAGSLLLTVLAEHVLAAGSDSVWQETLVECLQTLGHTSHAARQATARAVGDGWLRSERVGRRSRMRLTDHSINVLTQGTEQIMHFGESRKWDGKWLVVTVSVAGDRDEVRRRLRTLLAWNGFGALGNGVWINPWTDREAAVPGIFSEVDADVSGFCFRSELASIGDVGELVRTAWDLEALSNGYREFMDRFSEPPPDSPAEAFVEDTAMSHAWRRFIFVDPSLPRELLPEHWSGHEAYQLFQDRNATWRPIAHQYVAGLEERITSLADKKSNG